MKTIMKTKLEMKPNQKHKTIITPTVCKGQKEKLDVTFKFWDSSLVLHLVGLFWNDASGSGSSWLQLTWFMLILKAVSLLASLTPDVHQTSGPSSSYSWRSSTTNVCCPTSPPYRTTGVLQRLCFFPPNSFISDHTLNVTLWNVRVSREPVEREEERRGQFACWDGRRQSETHWDPESDLQHTPQVLPDTPTRGLSDEIKALCTAGDEQESLNSYSCFCLPSCKKGWTLILPSNIHLFIFPTPQFICYETAQLLLSCLFLPSPSSLSDTNLSAPILLTVIDLHLHLHLWKKHFKNLYFWQGISAGEWFPRRLRQILHVCRPDAVVSHLSCDCLGMLLQPADIRRRWIWFWRADVCRILEELIYKSGQKTFLTYGNQHQ